MKTIIYIMILLTILLMGCSANHTEQTTSSGTDLTNCKEIIKVNDINYCSDYFINIVNLKIVPLDDIYSLMYQTREDDIKIKIVDINIKKFEESNIVEYTTSTTCDILTECNVKYCYECQ
jgi:hypothetical protein